MNENERTADLDYKAFYEEHIAEIQDLKMKLNESERLIRTMENQIARLSAVKATVEVIFGRKIEE